MVRQLVEDAVKIKLSAKAESPLISVYEFCYAAGLALSVMGISQAQAEQLKETDSFETLKAEMKNLAGESAAFAKTPHGERLQRLVTGCRKKGQMDEDAKALFMMGYQSNL